MSESDLKASKEATFAALGVKAGGRRMSSGSVGWRGMTPGSEYLQAAVSRCYEGPRTAHSIHSTRDSIGFMSSEVMVETRK